MRFTLIPCLVQKAYNGLRDKIWPPGGQYEHGGEGGGGLGRWPGT
jgi:hypothetical protein